MNLKYWTIRFLSFIIIFSFVFSSYAQITYDKGYFIDTKSSKIECLIKNVNWSSNPTKIQYKLTENSEAVTKNIDSIAEFGVYNYSRYVRTNVNIDKSSSGLSTIENHKTPKWTTTTLFLKEIVQGKAQLWKYAESDRTWFFYSIDGSAPQQLVYNEYINENNLVANESYKQQLTTFISNEKTKNININNIKYNENSLAKYFKSFNSLTEQPSKNNSENIKRRIWDLEVFGALNSNTLTISYKDGIGENVQENFGRHTNWSTGLEFEYFLPFNRNQYSLLLTPTYERVYFSTQVGEKTKTFLNNIIDFTISGRYTKYFGGNFTSYFDIGINPPIAISINGNYNFSQYLDIAPKPDINFLLGIGASYKNIGIQFKYFTNREMLSHPEFGSKFSKLSLTLSYNILSHITK